MMNNRDGQMDIRRDHSYFITEMVRQLNCDVYLELGVYDGTTLSMVAPYVKRAIGVDISDLRKAKVGEFYKETTRSFFSHFNEKVDVVFIDADHSFESAKEDFASSLVLLEEFGVIMLHDTDPISPQFATPGYCGDSWKMNEWIGTNYEYLDVMTLPFTEAGLTIVKRTTDRRFKGI